MGKYYVTVKPNSSQEKIVKTNTNELTVYLHAKPHGGEANSSLINLLSKHFKAAKTNIKIIHGTKSHHKIIEF